MSSILGNLGGNEQYIGCIVGVHGIDVCESYKCVVEWSGGLWDDENALIWWCEVWQLSVCVDGVMDEEWFSGAILLDGGGILNFKV